MHGFHNLICVVLEDLFLRTKEVILWSGGGNVVVEPQASFIVKQHRRHLLLSCWFRQPIQDLLGQVESWYSLLGGAVDVNNFDGHV